VELKTDNLNFWKSISILLKDSCLVTDGDSLKYAGSTFTDLLAVDYEGLFGRSCDDFFCLQDKTSLSDAIRGLHTEEKKILSLQLLPVHLSTDHSQTLQVEFQQKEILGTKLIVGVIANQNTNQVTEQAPADTHLQLSTILESFSNTIFRTNMDGAITLISENVKELMGYTREEVIGTKLSNYYWSPEDRERSVQEIMKQNGNVAQLDTVMRHKDGSPVWIVSNVHLIKNEKDVPIGVEGIGHDVTYQKKLEQKLETLALTDSMTQLPNRRALMDELHRHYVLARANNSTISLVMVDIKGTKKVNEQYGYLYGDALIKQVATLLKVYTQFPQVFGRVSADEFLYILPGYNINNTVQFIAPIIEAVKQDPVMIGDKRVSYSLSFGLTELRKSDKNEFALLDRADKATLVSKHGVSSFEVM
jgi:diguanylate cyclase (GGDEF)-like protein/PAS domain S-box-containing protein